MKLEKTKISAKSLDTAILDRILDALISGVARSVLNSAVASISPSNVTATSTECEQR